MAGEKAIFNFVRSATPVRWTVQVKIGNNNRLLARLADNVFQEDTGSASCV
jgi:hypothetical protein